MSHASEPEPVAEAKEDPPVSSPHSPSYEQERKAILPPKMIPKKGGASSSLCSSIELPPLRFSSLSNRRVCSPSPEPPSAHGGSIPCRYSYQASIARAEAQKPEPPAPVAKAEPPAPAAKAEPPAKPEAPTKPDVAAKAKAPAPIPIPKKPIVPGKLAGAFRLGPIICSQCRKGARSSRGSRTAHHCCSNFRLRRSPSFPSP